jgi:hypothetical protein
VWGKARAWETGLGGLGPEGLGGTGLGGLGAEEGMEGEGRLKSVS